MERTASLLENLRHALIQQRIGAHPRNRHVPAGNRPDAFFGDFANALLNDPRIERGKKATLAFDLGEESPGLFCKRAGGCLHPGGSACRILHPVQPRFFQRDDLGIARHAPGEFIRQPQRRREWQQGDGIRTRRSGSEGGRSDAQEIHPGVPPGQHAPGAFHLQQQRPEGNIEHLRQPGMQKPCCPQLGHGQELISIGNQQPGNQGQHARRRKATPLSQAQEFHGHRQRQAQLLSLATAGGMKGPRIGNEKASRHGLPGHALNKRVNVPHKIRRFRALPRQRRRAETVHVQQRAHKARVGMHSFNPVQCRMRGGKAGRACIQPQGRAIHIPFGKKGFKPLFCQAKAERKGAFRPHQNQPVRTHAPLSAGLGSGCGDVGMINALHHGPAPPLHQRPRPWHARQGRYGIGGIDGRNGDPLQRVPHQIFGIAPFQAFPGLFLPFLARRRRKGEIRDQACEEIRIRCRHVRPHCGFRHKKDSRLRRREKPAIGLKRIGGSGFFPSLSPTRASLSGERWAQRKKKEPARPSFRACGLFICAFKCKLAAQDCAHTQRLSGFQSS